MSLETLMWDIFEWSAELQTLRDTIDHAPKTNGLPVYCFVIGAKFEVRYHSNRKQVTVVVSVGDDEIQRFRVNHNTTPGLLITTGKPGPGNDDPTKCIPVKRQLSWFYQQDNEMIFHNYPLVDQYDTKSPGSFLSDLGYTDMMLRIFPWLE